MTDIEKAMQLFRGSKLAFPTIPDKLGARLKELDKWLFSTREIEMSPYNLNNYVLEVNETDVEDYPVLSQRTTWDRDIKLEVSHEVVGTPRIVLAIAFGLGFFFLGILILRYRLG